MLRGVGHMVLRERAHEEVTVVISLLLVSSYRKYLLISHGDGITKTSFLRSRLEMFRQKLTLLIKVISCTDVNQDIRFRAFIFRDKFGRIMFCPFSLIFRSKVSRKSLCQSIVGVPTF
jgi:hypothetical protein